MEKRVAGPIGGVVVYIIPIINQSIYFLENLVVNHSGNEQNKLKSSVWLFSCTDYDDVVYYI